MLKKTLLALLLSLPLAALAQSQDQLIERYTSLAGSKENATSLVTGLRDGKEVTLKRGTTTETFTPTTGKMGYGNVDNALALAEASLQQKNISNPTPAQLEASVTEVLKMRADGMGWGQIAKRYDTMMGAVKRPERVSKVERPEKPQRPERPEKPERPGKGR